MRCVSRDDSRRPGAAGEDGKALGAVKPGPHSSGTHQLRGLPRERGENGILRQPLQDSSVRIKKGRDHLRPMSGTGNLRDGWGDIRE